MTGSADGWVMIWDIANKKCFIEFNVNKRINRFIKVDDKLVIIAAEQYIQFWDWAQKKMIADLQAHDDDITDMIMFPEFNLLLTCSADFSVKSWDILKGLQVRIYEGHSDRVNKIVRLNKLTKTEKELQQEKRASKFFQNENQVEDPQYYFLTSGDDFIIKCWNLNKIECLFQMTGHYGTINTLINLNDKMIASGDSEGLIIIWDMIERKPLFKLPPR